MCKLLIFAVNPSPHPTDVKVNAGQFQLGNVISIIEDDQVFGAFDIGPHTKVVELKGTPKVDLEHLISPEKLITHEVIGNDINHSETITKVRLWKAKDLDAFMLQPVRTLSKGDEVVFTETNFEKTAPLADPLIIG